MKKTGLALQITAGIVSAMLLSTSCNKAKTCACSVKYTYEDDYGNIYTETKNVSVNTVTTKKNADKNCSDIQSGILSSMPTSATAYTTNVDCKIQ